MPRTAGFQIELMQRAGARPRAVRGEAQALAQQLQGGLLQGAAAPARLLIGVLR